MLALAPVTHETLTGRGHVMSMDLGFRLVCVCVCVGAPFGLRGFFAVGQRVMACSPCE